jgi:hypothetical protein
MNLKPEVFAPVQTVPPAAAGTDWNSIFATQFSPWLTIRLSDCLYALMLPSESVSIEVTCPVINPVALALVWALLFEPIKPKIVEPNKPATTVNATPRISVVVFNFINEWIIFAYIAIMEFFWVTQCQNGIFSKKLSIQKVYLDFLPKKR